MLMTQARGFECGWGVGVWQAFISAFAASIAAEVKSRGIDVVSVHPSPVASNFYDKTHKLGAIEFFKQCAPLLRLAHSRTPPRALPQFPAAGKNCQDPSLTRRFVLARTSYTLPGSSTCRL